MSSTTVDPFQASVLTLAAIRATALYQPEVDIRAYVIALTEDLGMPERNPDNWCSACWVWGDHDCKAA